jgi:branched-chain amino acid transport system permease protein
LMVGVVALNWTGVTGGAEGLYAIPVSVTPMGMVLILLAVVVLLAMLQRGTIGRTLDVSREDEQLAATVGIDTKRYHRLAFVVSAMLGGLAGALHALTFNTISPEDAGFSFIILALAMVIIGGYGSWLGALLGAVVLTYLPYKLTSVGEWWPVMYGATLILVATYLPGGFYGIARQSVLQLLRLLRSSRSRQEVAPASTTAT